jgi:aryl-alcohol dehydrogenase-like predicted oxidoreductase
MHASAAVTGATSTAASGVPVEPPPPLPPPPSAETAVTPPHPTAVVTAKQTTTDETRALSLSMDVLSKTLDTASVHPRQAAPNIPPRLDIPWGIDDARRAMKTRRFGRMGTDVSEIGTGMWGMVSWSGADLDEARRALQRAVDRGCTFFDTAFAYGDGKSEQLLGELVRANPGKRLFTATKVPPKNRRWPAKPEHTLDESYPPDYVESYLKRSLENLGLPRVDLFQFHTWQDAWLADARLPRTIERLRADGLVGGVGISLNRWEPWNGVEAVRLGLVDAVQVIYNVFDQNPEDQLFPACEAADVAVIARVPFDEGSLTDTLTRTSKWPRGDWRNLYFCAENLEPTIDRVERLRPLVPAGQTMASMALRFILDNPTVSTVIPGMRKLAHVDANLAVSDAGPLPERLRGELRAHRWDRLPTAWSF